MFRELVLLPSSGKDTSNVLDPSAQAVVKLFSKQVKCLCGAQWLRMAWSKGFTSLGAFLPKIRSSAGILNNVL